MLEKRTGSFTGWIAYTLSKSDRQFDAINDGKVFPFSHDRRHNISVVSTYKINKNKELTASWVYTSGYYMTLNKNRYVIELDGHQYEIANYAERNNFRTPAYHRLDLAYSVSKQKKRGLRTWTFGLYNAYNRVNPFTINHKYLSEEEIINSEQPQQPQQNKLVVGSLFPIIPSVSYTFEF